MNNLVMEVITAVSNELFFRSLLFIALVAIQTVRYQHSSRRTKGILFLSLLPLLILVVDYHNFTVAVGEREVWSFYTSFLNHYFYFYFAWVLTLTISIVAMFDQKS